MAHNQKHSPIPERCALCLQEAALCKSHIIPEFCFKPFYDKNHRIIEVSNVEKGKVRRRQKGIWERLLCAKCEALLNGWERLSRRVFTDSLPPHETGSKRVRVFVNITYTSFKLFMLSILWRASVTTHSFFRHVSLGPHEELIRHMILNGNAGEAEDYPMMIFALHFQGQHMPDLMFEPTYMRVHGLKCYRFVFTGIIAMIYVTGQVPSPGFMRWALAPEKPVRIYDGELSEFRFLRDVWNRVAETTKDVVI